MNKGRLTLKEQKRRLMLLLEFVFIFRYATRSQLLEFGSQIIGLTYPRGLIDYAKKTGLIHGYYEPMYKTKIYYLTKKGKDFIYEDIALAGHYRFDKRHTGVNSFQKHLLLVEAYLRISRCLEVKLTNWVSEWILRIGKKKRHMLPNGLFVTGCGTKVAIELYAAPKTMAFLKKVVSIYRYDIEKTITYHAVLILICHRDYYEGLKKRLYSISMDFCQRAFIFADIDMLEAGQCFYKDEVRGIAEALDILHGPALS